MTTPIINKVRYGKCRGCKNIALLIKCNRGYCLTCQAEWLKWVEVRNRWRS